ncbi:MAG: hypothetical protein ACM30E_05170 [Nitrososphaerales archaeon]
MPLTTRRLATYALLHFAQGSILSYFTAQNALYLLSFNLSMAQIGLFGMIALTPFVRTQWVTGPPSSSWPC